MNKKVLGACQAISNRLAEQGAEAVVLLGSWVRGDAYRESDLDIHAIGKGPHYRLERYKDFLVSTSWAPARQDRKTFKDPRKVGGVIPAWRNAVIIHDPKGIAEAIKKEAEERQWGSLGKTLTSGSPKITDEQQNRIVHAHHQR